MSRRAHKAHVTKSRHKIDDTAEGTITETHNILLKSFVSQLIINQKWQTLKEFIDKIVVLLETPEDLGQEIFEAKELDGLILGKVRITEKFIKLTSKNVNQPMSSPQV